MVKPLPQWVRVILRAVAVAACMAGVIGGAFGLAWVGVNWPATTACTAAVGVLLIIAYVWDEESNKDW